MAFSRKRGESASALRETAFNSIAHLYRRKKFPWLSVWTMESHHGIHVHALLWAPEGRKFRSQLAVLLIDRFRMPWDPWATPWEQISRQNSNAPVCIVPINDDRGFKRVGKWGLDGVIDYVAKDIDSNVDSRIVSKRLGKITGATKLILDIRKARAVPRPRTIKISSSPAGGARP